MPVECGRRLWLGGRLLRLGVTWQEHVETRPLANRALALDPAAMLLDDAEDHGEAEAGALAGVLGGEERLEDALTDLGGHAVAGGADTEPDILARPRLEVPAQKVGVGNEVGGLEDDAAALGHGVARVEGEVHQHLADLARVGFDEPQIWGGAHFNVNARVEGAAQEAHRLLDGAIEVVRLGPADGAAREDEQALRHACG